MKSLIRNYFTFNRRERRGTFVLLCIIVLELIYLSLAPNFSGNANSDFNLLEKEVSWKKAKNFSKAKEYSKRETFVEPKKKERIGERFAFNPNHLSTSDWKRLGLSDKQIDMIHHYESKGGHFYKKNDFQKMYCISEKLYRSLEPYLVFPEREKVNSFKKKKLLVELNAADTLSLDSLKGIGGAFARRIVKYRERLGGFLYKEQLLEVFGFDEAKLELIQENISVDSNLVRKININIASAELMGKHPYIRYTLSQAIVNYRKQHGPFQALADLRRIDLVNDELYRKLAAYLEVR